MMKKTTRYLLQSIAITILIVGFVVLGLAFSHGAVMGLVVCGELILALRARPLNSAGIAHQGASHLNHCFSLL